MSWYEELDQKMADYLPDVPVLREEPLSRHTSFRIGGPARRMAFPKSGEQLVLLVSFARACGARPFVLGNGTNLLFGDGETDRLVISTRDLAQLRRGGSENEIIAGAGVPLARLAVFAQQAGLTGLEFAHGIPGSVGGAVCMNAGAYDGEMKGVVKSVTLLLPEEGVHTLSGADMAFGYRRSFLTDHPETVVLEAAFSLRPGNPAAIRARMEELMARRKKSQPLEWPSAGSTFKRPTGYFAGPLIEQAGLKGFSVGRAQVSEKHAGFVINRGGATCADVRALIGEVQRRVQERAGVLLEPEVKFVEK